MTRIFWRLLAVVVGVTAVSACASSNPFPLSARLKWDHQVQFAGIYTALEEGYYAGRNLDVTLEEVDKSRDATWQSVMDGENDIGIGAPEELIIARSQGAPVKAIAVIFKLNPFVYVVSPDSDVETPYDFVGETIVVSPGQGTMLYATMMDNLGIDRSQINEIPSHSFNIEECWAGSGEKGLPPAAACPTYATAELARARYEGWDVAAIWPSDYGVPFYGDVIYTTDDFLEQHPDEVAAFVAATLQGWQKASDEPELATQYTLRYDPALDEAAQLSALETSLPLIDTGQTEIGWMDPAVWQRMYDVLWEQGFIEEPFDVTAVYTNEFVEQAYNR